MSVDNRPRATYRTDATAAVGQVMGPTLAGELLVLDSADYDPDTDTTVCRFRYATTADVIPSYTLRSLPLQGEER